MLRRTPSTRLVCLVLFLSSIYVIHAAAADPQESLEILLKPNDGTGSTIKQPKATTSSARAGKRHIAPQPAPYFPPNPAGPITKVKPAFVQACYTGGPPCVLPRPLPGQWDMSAGVIMGRTRGRIAWPRYSNWWSGYGWSNEASLNDDFGIPEHGTMATFSAKYQFRPNWAARYTIMGNQFNGTGWPSQQILFGPSWYNWWITPGQQIQSTWQHTYQKIELVYDALKTCSGQLSLSGGWVHTDDKITLSCVTCGYYSKIFSQGGDMGYAGMELQRCIQTAPNGGTLSTDCKAGIGFLDDTIAADIEAGLRYAIPLGCGRTGYMKAGYRFVDIKKSQTDLLFTNALEGGFVTAGFIF